MATIKATLSKPRCEVAASYSPDVLDQMPIEEIWSEYQRTHSAAIRNWLMVRFLHLVRYKAERLHARLPDEVDVQDLVQAGHFGLMDAIDDFDPSRGVKFETYSANRIRGAILDELRHSDWVPRLVRNRAAQIDRAERAFYARNGRRPSEEETASELGVDDSQFEKIRRDGRAAAQVSLERKWFETDSSKDVREVDVIEDDRQVSPFDETHKHDLRDLITKGLNRAERLIVVLYYYEEMTMKEIGQTLDLSESRVSQMHSSILARLRAQLLHREREFYQA